MIPRHVVPNERLQLTTYRSSITVTSQEYYLLEYFQLLSGNNIRNCAVSDLRMNAEIMTRQLARRQALPASLSQFSADDLGTILVLAKKIEDS